jgi:hypothetical protein
LEFLTAAWAFAFAWVLVRQRSIDRRAWPTWDSVRYGAWRVEGLRDSLQRRREVVALAVEGTRAAHAAGQPARAGRMLQASIEALELLTADLLEWLEQWADRARVLLALAPTASPRVGELRLLRLSALTVVWRLLHAVVSTERERFLLRTVVLSRALRTLLRFWRATGLPRRADPTWERARVLENDLAVLSEASVKTYEALLSSHQAATHAQTA